MWTATALASELCAYAGTVWRIVEAQHRISTNRLTSDLGEQARLEAMAEAAKPDLPKAALGLHYLLAAPFRYGHSVASRFRKAGERPGIFYASEAEATAIAETAYWRLAFFSRAVGFVPPAATSEHSSFCVDVSAERSLDLTVPPLSGDEPGLDGPARLRGLPGACRTGATGSSTDNPDLVGPGPLNAAPISSSSIQRALRLSHARPRHGICGSKRGS
jgi:hypothetical protein